MGWDAKNCPVLYKAILEGVITRQLYLGVSLAALAAASTATAQSSTEVYDYDALGRLISVVTTGGANDGDAHAICYDAAGNRTSYESRSDRTVPACAEGSSPPPPPPPPPPPAPSLSVSNASITEGGNMTFFVNLSAAHTSSVSVNYATADNSAGSADYYAVSGTLTFSPGQTGKSVVVTTRQDAIFEGDETFYLNLSSPTGGATISDSQGAGLILDDDFSDPCDLNPQFCL
jgi:YD repeat-containing protein